MRRRCWRPVGPFGLFQTGPHRTFRELFEDFRELFIRP
jgi:hypothetical protein